MGWYTSEYHANKHRERQKRYNKSPVGKVRQRAVWQAVAELKKNHSDEYKALYAKFVEEGLQNLDQHQRTNTGPVSP